MTTYVIRDGRLVVKHKVRRDFPQDFTFPVPFVSHFESFESPITGQTISSWRQRDADMQAGGAVDPRDLDRGPFDKRAADNARRDQQSAPFQWGEPTT